MYTKKDGSVDPAFAQATTPEEVLEIVKGHEGYDDTYDVIEQDYFRNLNPNPRSHKFKTKAEAQEAIRNGTVKYMDTYFTEETGENFTHTP